MAEPETKLARLVTWVRDNMDRQGGFSKSDLYSFARGNGIERLALDFLYRCRKRQTIQETGANRVVVLVPKGQSLGQFYKDLLKIQGEPVLRGRPKPPVPKKKGPRKEGEKVASQLKKGPRKEEGIQPAKPTPEKEPSGGVPGLANAITERLENRLKRVDDTVASMSTLVESRIGDLEKRVSGVIVRELEKRIKQLETQLEEFRAKAEAFDLIKRDAWEVIQALDIVEAEKEDVKKVLKKFVRPTMPQ